MTTTHNSSDARMTAQAPYESPVSDAMVERAAKALQQVNDCSLLLWDELPDYGKDCLRDQARAALTAALAAREGAERAPVSAAHAWRRRWKGSPPEKGFSIVAEDHLTHPTEIAFLGEVDGDAVDAIINAHNASLATPAPPVGAGGDAGKHVEVLRELLHEYEGDEPGPMGFSEERAALDAAIDALTARDGGGALAALDALWDAALTGMPVALDLYSRIKAGMTATPAVGDDRFLREPLPVPTDIMEARAQGRAEALAILLNESADAFDSEYMGSHSVGCTGDYGTHWDEDKLRKLLRAEDSAWSLMQAAENEYWHNLGLREAAQQEYEAAIAALSGGGVMVANMPEWMRDRAQVEGLLAHLEGLGWRPDSKGDPECFDQGAAMSADVIRHVLLPLLAAHAQAGEGSNGA